MKLRFLLLSVSLFCIALASCKDDDDKNPQPDPSGTENNVTLKANNFIREVMQTFYLWNRDLRDYDIRQESDPAAYFRKLLVEEDKWSYITDEGEDFVNSLKGVEKTFGFEYTFFPLDGNNVGICVNYLYPGTPAARKGLSRGDIILTVNNEWISMDNYKEINTILQSSGEVVLGVSKLDPVSMKLSQPAAMEMTAEVANLDPVHTFKVIEKNNTKIGYLFYTSFVGDFNASLDLAFREFRNAGISDLILDLRYNSGGDDKAIINLCSHIAPSTVVSQSKVFLTDKFNDDYMAYLKYKGQTETTETRFDPELVENNPDLDRVFVLTGEYTASASEATIIGLKPYMDVVCIGEKTYGKYTSMFQLASTDKEISNWILLPVVAQYMNAEGNTCKGGITPDYEENVLYLPLKPLGDEEDPLLARAMELITGTPVVAAVKSRAAFPGAKALLQGFSKYDEIKNNRIRK